MCRRKYHKLYYLYKPKLYFWIIIVLMRKLGLCLTALMFRSNPAFQLAMSLLVTFYAYVLQVAYRPYLCLGENGKVLKDHRKSVADGSRLHAKIDLSLRYAVKVHSQKGATVATKLGGADNAALVAVAKMGGLRNNNTKDKDDKGNAVSKTNKPVKGAQVVPEIITSGFAGFLVNYNTVEAVLLGCAVLINLVRGEP